MESKLKNIFVLMIIAYSITNSQQAIKPLKPIEIKKNYSGEHFHLDPISDLGCQGFDSLGAGEDIKRDKPLLLIIGGYTPGANTEKDIDFENRYKIKYYDFGCSPPKDDCVMKYNKVIFEYLDKKYGKGWRVNVRKDVYLIDQ